MITYNMISDWIIFFIVSFYLDEYLLDYLVYIIFYDRYHKNLDLIHKNLILLYNNKKFTSSLFECSNQLNLLEYFIIFFSFFFNLLYYDIYKPFISIYKYYKKYKNINVLKSFLLYLILYISKLNFFFINYILLIYKYIILHYLQADIFNKIKYSWILTPHIIFTLLNIYTRIKIRILTGSRNINQLYFLKQKINLYFYLKYLIKYIKSYFYLSYYAYSHKYLFILNKLLRRKRLIKARYDGYLDDKIFEFCMKLVKLGILVEAEDNEEKAAEESLKSNLKKKKKNFIFEES